MDNESARLRALMRGAIVFTSLAVLGAIALFVLEQRRTQTVLPVLFDVPDFALTNQAGRVVSRADLLGNVWLADLQTALPADQPVRLVTLTTDPTYDTPAVLRAYANRFGADPARWHFLTGTKSQIARLAANGLRLTAVEKELEEREAPEDLFIHSTILVLVDRRGRVRATFETDQPDVNTRVVTAVNALLRERQ